jgi:anti-sigma regulatory factor (Ser/Thr protein kinase)
VTVTVKDEGEGVDPDCLPDPLSPECRLKRGGRGLYIISHMAELMYNGKGGVSAKLKQAE